MSDYHITMDCILIFSCLCWEAAEQPAANVLCWGVLSWISDVERENKEQREQKGK